MSDAVEQAKLYIQDENYEEALKIAKKRHSKDDIEEYISILDLLIDEDYLLALEEKGMYYQYYDETHDNGDYGEKYFDEYLEKQPRSINALCDKAMSRFNKNKVDEALEYMDKAAIDEGHFIIFDRTPGKPWEEKIWHEEREYEGRKIMVWGM